MRRFLFLLLILTFALAAAAHDHRGRRHMSSNLSISIDDDEGAVATCNAIRVTFEEGPAQRAQEELPVSGLRSLRVRTDKHGGIYVARATDNRLSVTLCKASAAGADLGAIRPEIRGNELSIDGPAGGRWVAFFLVRAPRGFEMDLEARNGPINIAGVDGVINARTKNGPLSIRDTTGTVDGEAVNGPISLSGGSGRMKLNAQNGPVSVKLSGSTWNGKLDASTQNGPVSLKIPRGYRSAVLVEALGHGPVSCKADVCSEARKTFDDDVRRIEFGYGGDPIVRLSTVNGPVSVNEHD